MKSLSSKIKMKKRKTFKKSNDMSKRSYLQFLKKRKSKTPVDNIVKKNVELMEQNISPQNIHDVDKPLKQSTVNRVKLLEQPKIDIKMPKKVQSEKDKNIKSVFVEEDLKQPKFVFDRTNKLDNLSSTLSNLSFLSTEHFILDDFCIRYMGCLPSLCNTLQNSVL